MRRLWPTRQAGTRPAYGGIPVGLPPDLRRENDPVALQVLDYLVIEQRSRLMRWAEINVTAIGNTTVLTGIPGQKLTVVSLDFVVSAAVSISWLSAATTIRNAQAFAANSGMARDLVRPYYLQTNPGEALIMNLSAAVNVRGALGFVQVPS